MATIKPGHVKKKSVARHAWIILPLGAMVVVCMGLVVLKPYALANFLSPSLYDAFWFPPFPALLVALFGIMYIYKTLQKKFINHIARVIACLLLAIFGVFIIIIGVAILSKGHQCNGLFALAADCPEVNARVLYAVFGNPYSLVVISGLALAGGGALLAAPDRPHINKQ